MPGPAGSRARCSSKRALRGSNRRTPPTPTRSGWRSPRARLWTLKSTPGAATRCRCHRRSQAWRRREHGNSSSSSRGSGRRCLALLGVVGQLAAAAVAVAISITSRRGQPHNKEETLQKQPASSRSTGKRTHGLTRPRPREKKMTQCTGEPAWSAARLPSLSAPLQAIRWPTQELEPLTVQHFHRAVEQEPGHQRSGGTIHRPFLRTSLISNQTFRLVLIIFA